METNKSTHFIDDIYINQCILDILISDTSIGD